MSSPQSQQKAASGAGYSGVAQRLISGMSNGLQQSHITVMRDAGVLIYTQILPSCMAGPQFPDLKLAFCTVVSVLLVRCP